MPTPYCNPQQPPSVVMDMLRKEQHGAASGHADEIAALREEIAALREDVARLILVRAIRKLQREA